jgi:sodium/bile acid cotransporter 7
MNSFFIRRWFLLTLAGLLIVGGVASPWLDPIAQIKWLRDGLVAAVLFVMALPLEARQIGEAIRRPGPSLVATLLNSVLAPLLGWLLSPALHPTLGLGLIVAASTPCTLASASVWTRRAGGNDAVSMVVTVLTNLACFVVTPFWLFALTGRSAQNNSMNLVGKLAALVVLPMVLAQLVRLAPTVARWSVRHKTPLGLIAQAGVLWMVFIGAIQMGQSLRTTTGSSLIGQLPLMIGVVLAVHVVVLFCGIVVARILRFSPENQIAVGLAGSQKTLMVGLQVSLELDVSVLPMITYHVGQLLIDTLVVDRWREHHKPGPAIVDSRSLG